MAALLGDYLARAIAGGALRHGLLYAEDCLLLHGYMSAAVATVTSGEGHAVFCAGAFAVLTFYECGHAESFCNAFGDVFEREFYAYAHIAAATLARLTAAAFCTAEAAEVKSGAEYTVKYR